MDAKSKVTGKQELVTIPMVSTASDFEKAISSKGTWIIALTKNLSIDKNLVVNGEYKSDKNIVERKIALYSQNKANKITARFTLAIPKLIIDSPQTSIEHGIFKGDIYVTSKNFQLIDTIVEGNVYFTTNEAKSTFKMDAKSKVTGKQELISSRKATPNVGNTVSIVSTTAAFEEAISSKGTWFIAIAKNLTSGKDIIERKIDLYS